MIRTAFATARTSGLLPAIGWTILIVGLLALSSGLWLGYEWRKGRDALADVAAMKEQRRADGQVINELHTAAERAAQRDAKNAAAYREASERMGAIASQLENTHALNRAFSAQQRKELDSLLRRNPDLARVDVGADLLRHWNASNQGAGGRTEPAAPASRQQPEAALPTAAGSSGRPAGQPAGKPRRSDRAVPRLRGRQGSAGPGGERMGADCVALVLRCAGRSWPRQPRLQGGA
jgi:hypothetical protein